MRHPARALLVLLALFLLPAALLRAQGSAAAPAREEASLGLKLAVVPEVLYTHIPELKRGQGVLVEAIRPGSRAAELGLEPYDIVLAVGTAPVTCSEELPGKLRGLEAGEREVLQIIRGGKPFALTVASPAADRYSPPKSLFKPGGPPAVSVQIKPMSAGTLEVNLFYLNPSNEMERHALHGSLADIERQAADLAEQGQMSANIHDLVALALQRARGKAPATPR